MRRAEGWTLSAPESPSTRARRRAMCRSGLAPRGARARVRALRVHHHRAAARARRPRRRVRRDRVRRGVRSLRDSYFLVVKIPFLIVHVISTGVSRRSTPPRALCPRSKRRVSSAAMKERCDVEGGGDA
jgi:hypothetical protein